ncbi:MAG: TetR/AcrR family transcriptional regulator [Acidimicrobiia bacterium]|nr:TetR/AcrR family transcriptional regulator [Acidimicrobiia bacterium]
MAASSSREARPEAADAGGLSPMQERILDAAWDLFSAQGVQATTMSRIADETGISRVWLYRQFPNRDAIVRALVLRETVRFVDGMNDALANVHDDGEVVEVAFAWGVRWCREHELLNALLTREPDSLLPDLTTAGRPVLTLGARLVSRHLCEAGVDAERANLLADWVVRMVMSHTLTRTVLVELDDEPSLRAYARAALVSVPH